MISIGALVASTGVVLAQSASDLPYCADLKQLNNLAMSQGRFAPIVGKSREGNFRETTLPLTGSMNCAFYGARTYTCDSPAFETA
jgi:hypothetical protein